MKSIQYLLLSLFLWMHIEGGLTYRDGWLVSTDVLPTMTAEEHYKTGLDALECKDWNIAAKNFYIVTYNFPTSPHYSDSAFNLGVSYYQMEELYEANQAFTTYLESQSHPARFEEAIWYKLEIADAFRCGALRRPFGLKQLPKWMPSRSTAYEIYNDIISAMPCSDYAANALCSKAWLLWCDADFRSAIDTYQLFIRRFPKHELTPECYLAINQIYLDQCRCEYQNPDIIAYAEINTLKLKQAFPRSEFCPQAELLVLCIKEEYANGLYETGRLYERKCEPGASIFYYVSTIKQFPETCSAEWARERLRILDCDMLYQIEPPSARDA